MNKCDMIKRVSILDQWYRVKISPLFTA